MTHSKQEYESKQFRNLRYIVGGLFIFGYVFYLVYLAYNLVFDSPMLKADRAFLNQTDIPGMIFTFSYY